MKKLLSIATAFAFALPVWAIEPETNVTNATDTPTTVTSEDEPSGFFTSMFVTNDVSLIIFVPLTILLFRAGGRADCQNGQYKQNRECSFHV